MFTGLISAVGTVTAADHSDGGLELEIDSPYGDVAVGESIAIDGACLTVVRVAGSSFAVHVIATSIDRTVFGAIRPGSRVNLERALRLGDRLGGHLVQGHVDGVGQVVAVTRRDDAVVVDLSVPDDIARICIPLGSIAVNGVSLTVNAIPDAGVVQISLIPITLDHTTLGSLTVGDPVHLEGDVIGKYLAALARPWTGGAAGGE